MALRDTLKACKQASQKPRIVLHILSNSGTNSETQVLIELHQQLGSGKPLPLMGIICDSDPAVGTLRKSYNCIPLSLPKGWLWRAIGPIVLQYVVIVLLISVAAGRYEQHETMSRRTLLDERYLSCGKVCYLLSKAETQI